jgi:hypothetical protein
MGGKVIVHVLIITACFRLSTPSKIFFTYVVCNNADTTIHDVIIIRESRIKGPIVASSSRVDGGVGGSYPLNHYPSLNDKEECYKY